MFRKRPVARESAWLIRQSCRYSTFPKRLNGFYHGHPLPPAPDSLAQILHFRETYYCQSRLDGSHRQMLQGQFFQQQQCLCRHRLPQRFHLAGYQHWLTQPSQAVRHHFGNDTGGAHRNRNRHAICRHDFMTITCRNLTIQINRKGTITCI